MSRMDSSFDGEAENAFRQATRVLQSRKLRWADVANGVPPGPDQVKRAQSSTSPHPETSSYDVRKQCLKGTDIPVNLHGYVRSYSQHAHSGLTWLNFFVEDSDNMYGPIIAWDEHLLLKLLESAEKRYPVSVWICHSGPRNVPSVLSVAPSTKTI